MPRNTSEPAVRMHYLVGFRYWSRRSIAPAPRLDPVVLIGGALHRKEDWGRIEQGMLETADVVCPDLPGWGQADLLPARYGSGLLSEALVRLLDDLGIERANVFAGSYGTAIAYRLAQDHPERVNRVVLAGTMSEMPPAARPAMADVLRVAASGRRERFGPAAVAMLMNPDRTGDIVSGRVVQRLLEPRFGGVDATEIAKFTANTERLLRHRLIDPAIPVRVPALFTVGEHDTLTPPRACRDLALAAGHAWFTQIRQADHAVHLERPRELVDLMTRFFSDEPLHSLPYTTPVEDLRHRTAPIREAATLSR